MSELFKPLKEIEMSGSRETLFPCPPSSYNTIDDHDGVNDNTNVNVNSSDVINKKTLALDGHHEEHDHEHDQGKCDGIGNGNGNGNGGSFSNSHGNSNGNEWTFSIPSKGIHLSNPHIGTSMHASKQKQEGAPPAEANIDTDTDTNRNSTSTSTTNQSESLGWKFANRRTNWSLSSKNILTITYTSSEQAVPSYTNKSIGVDYIQRLCKRVKRRRTGSGYSCSRQKRVYQERYDADDVLSVKFLGKEDIGVDVSSFTKDGGCHGVQIVLRNKTGTKRRFPTAAADGGSTGPNYGNGNGGAESPNRIPMDGKKILEENGFLPKEKDGMEDGIPLPPWCQKDDTGASAGAGSSAATDDHSVHGPIVTFLMPNVSQEQPIQDENCTGNGVKRQAQAPPLLWKVQFPPDPSIALEAFTVLDGSLDVHSASDLDCKNDNSSTTRSANSGGITASPSLSQWRKLQSQSSYSDSECSASHPTNIYLNGYQSWSFAGSVTQGDEQPKSAMPDFLSKSFNFGADIPPPPTEDEVEFEGDVGWNKGPGGGAYVRREKRTVDSYSSSEDDSFQDLTYYKSDFYTCVSCNEAEDTVYSDENDGVDNGNDSGSSGNLDENGGPAMVLGFLSQRRSYGLIAFDSDLCCVAMHASLQGTIASRSTGISTDWAYCQILPGDYYDEEPMVDYLNAVCSHNVARPLQKFPPLTGWCSWYHYYENIDSSTLKENFKELSDLKSKITSDAVIIDDGYMTSWGDWSSLKPKGFPENSGGMKGLADSIASNEMIPGIWMAPYACDKNSKLAKEHPDWIIRNDQGRIANSANCGKFFYGLDATNPAVRQYAFTCIRRAVKEWGYKVLKLDFLYAACLAGNGKYDLSMTRAETMHLALQTLRAAAGPETFIIGCGCPIGPAIGLIDANRVSADTGPTWYPDFPLPWWDHATLPSLRAMVRNTISRSCLGHRFWHNDPDCILLGDTTRLTEVEVKSAATVIAMTGGMLLLSDDLSKLSSERLRVASRIFPVTGVTGITLDLHNTSESGIPSLIRLWCTDEVAADFQSATAVEMASNNAKRTSFSSDKSWDNRSIRNRNCLPVAKGLGTWSMLSLSNWLDKPADVSVPFSASLPPKKVVETQDLHLGYHVFSFWMSKYAWVATNQSGKKIRKKLGPHESEIFHVKPVSLNHGQYIGSELHFTCGYEVISFHSTSTCIDLQLRNDLKRSGFVYLYLPCYSNAMKVTMSGMAVRGEVVFRTPKIGHNNTFYGGQVIRVWVVVNGNKSTDDGRVTVNI